MVRFFKSIALLCAIGCAVAGVLAGAYFTRYQWLPGMSSAQPGNAEASLPQAGLFQ